jgi:cytochrome c-type biogenesis protein CcmH
MLLLLLLALALLVATLWWLSRPLWQPAHQSVASGERADLEQLRDRLLNQLNELEGERADHGMDADVAAQEEQRLSVELAAVLKQLEAGVTASAAPTTDHRSGWRPMLAIGAVVVLLGAGLYAVLNRDNLKGFWLAAESGAPGARVPPMVFDMVKRLEKKLAENPNDAGGWARLARSYMVLERKDKALDAYARAYKLNPDNPEVLSDYAWILFNDNPQVTTGLVNDLYSRLHRLQPEHPDALWFMGFAALQKGETGKTVQYWEKLLKLMPPQDPARAQLQQAIQGVRQRPRR